MMLKLFAGAVCAMGLAAGQGLAQVVYVDGAAAAGGDGNSWGGAYRDLQAALTRARLGAVTEVRVAQGTYKPGTTGSRIVSFVLVNGVAMRGGYAGVASVTPDVRDLRRTPTILTGDVAGDDIDGGGRGGRSDNLLHVVQASNLTARTVIDGFHIRGGQASGTADQGEGAGLRVVSSGDNLVMANCIVRDNFGTQTGAGLRTVSSGCTLVNCVFAGNRAYGAAGVGIDASFSPTAPTIDHCVIAYNTNNGPWRSDGVDIGGSSTLPVYRGSIVFGNWNANTFPTPQPGQIAGNYTAVNSIAEAGGNWLGDGSNKTGNPLFADAAGADGVIGSLDDDFRLRPDSPAIDSGGAIGADVADVDGDGDLTELTPLDADGAARDVDAAGVAGNQVDMGAFEGPALGPRPSVFALSVPERGTAPLQVTMSRAIASPVTVTLSGVGLTVTPPTLTFTPGNWDVPQAVSVFGQSDADYINTERSLRLTAPGMSSALVAVTVVDADVSPTMVIVNPQGTLPADGMTWASGYRTIDAALAAANVWPAATQIWIKAGTYVPTTVGLADPRAGVIACRGGLTLMGGFAGTESSPAQRDGAHETVLTGDYLGDDGAVWPSPNIDNNCYYVVQFNSAEGETGLDGLTVRGARDCAVVGNLAGLPATSANNLRLRNCRFEHNQMGGVSWFTRGLFEATGCAWQFNGNVNLTRSPLDVSGAPLGGVAPQMRLVDCVFSDNHGQAGGATLVKGRVEVTGCDFLRNLSTGGGSYNTGALVVALRNDTVGQPVGSASVSGCSFEQNAGQYGAGLQLSREGSVDPAGVMTVSVSASEFVGNTANSGAGLFGSGNTTAALAPTTVTGCLFDGNSVSQSGGAVVGFRLDGCTLRNNTAQDGGAAAGTQLFDCLLENNTALHQGGAGVGIRVTRCTLRGNSAPTGGAMYDGLGTSSTVTVKSSVFESNHATSATGTGGGAVVGVIAVDSTFVGNTSAADGGAASGLWAYRCRFAGNHADGNGGGLYQSEAYSCLLTGNSAGGTGGAGHTVTTVSNCTVSGNSAATVGGVAAAYFVENSILWGNTSSGAVQDKQISLSFQSAESVSELAYGRNTTPGQAVSGGFCMPGPATGGFVGPLDPVVLTTVAYPSAGTQLAYAVTTPAGFLPSLTLNATSAQAKWVSTQPLNTTVSPSALFLPTGVGVPTNYTVFSYARLELTFAVDGQLGDATHAGVYLGGVGLPGSGGGGPTAATTRVMDVSDLMTPGATQRVWLYNRNDAGFGGVLAYLKIVVGRPQVSSCIVQGLTTLAGHGNLGGDPLFVNLTGADGVLGTADDDGTLADGSPALDSGNGRLIAADAPDFDDDNDIRERLMLDLLGNSRVTDLPGAPNTGEGALGAVDRGAVERQLPACSADVGGPGGLPVRDGVLNNNDFVVFVDLFFSADPRADMGSVGGVAGSDGFFDNNDFIVFIDRFFAGC
jgi:hypothetical protein